MDTDIKTRVTPVGNIKAPKGAGQDYLVVIYSSKASQLGRRLTLSDDVIRLGRGSDNTMVLENDSVSRRHARIEKQEDVWYVHDLGSTNGTFVNDEPVTSYALQRGDQVKVGDTILKYLSGSDVEAQYHETIYRMTIIDGLTELYNKRYLLETLEREIPRARRHKRPLSLLLFDIDHFKRINDGFGHLAGDYVLKEIAGVIGSRLRPDDVLGRYGGEEFIVVLPETRLEGATRIAEQLRERVEHHTFAFEEDLIAVTISLGAAELSEGWRVDQFIRVADAKLYEAKRLGRNRTCAASNPVAEPLV